MQLAGQASRVAAEQGSRTAVGQRSRVAAESVSDPHSFDADPDPGSRPPLKKVLVTLSMNILTFFNLFI